MATRFFQTRRAFTVCVRGGALWQVIRGMGRQEAEAAGLHAQGAA